MCVYTYNHINVYAQISLCVSIFLYIHIWAMHENRNTSSTCWVTSGMRWVPTPVYVY